MQAFALGLLAEPPRDGWEHAAGSYGADRLFAGEGGATVASASVAAPTPTTSAARGVSSIRSPGSNSEARPVEELFDARAIGH